MNRLFSIILFSLIAFVSSFAQYSGNVALNTANAFFISDSTGDVSGHHVSIVPDLNGDDYDEVLITAPGRNVGASPDNGEVYLFYGGSAGFTGSYNLSDADAVFYGEYSGNEASHDSYGIGDIDNDGYNDLAISIKKTQNLQGGSRMGKVYIFFGGSLRSGRISLETADASLIGDEVGAEAAHIKGVGDINNDGYDDVIVGAGFDDQVGQDGGKVYVFFGKSRGQWAANMDMETNCDASFVGENGGDWAGHRVSSVGDVDGDGYNDFIVGANKTDIGSDTDNGTVYLIKGKSTAEWGKDVSLANANASWNGASRDNMGWGVGNRIGDVDGDGLDDIIFNTNKSKYILILAKNIQYTLGQNAVDAADAVLAHPSVIWDNIGHDVSSAGDLNGDGINDIIIGNAAANDNGASKVGKTFLFLGRETWPKNVNMETAEAIFVGENADDNSGFSVSGNGDINGDGSPDILISAWHNADGGENAGKSYLFQTEPLSFKVLAPNGGEVWFVGQTQNIRWVNTDEVGQVNLEYSTDNGTSWTEIANNVDNNGSYTWTVPNEPSTQCLVRIQDFATGNPVDTSDNLFEISNASSITIETPNGGEFWVVGSDQTIEWNTSNISGQVNVELSRDGGSAWETLVENTIDDGAFEWSVAGPATENALVRVTDADGTPNDVSDAPFSIIEQPTVTLISPNGGQVLTVTDELNIQWSSENSSGFVAIELSRDGGKTFKKIASQYEDIGNWTWTVTGPASKECLIRVSDLNGLASDVSDTFFEITITPGVTLTSPNGGENWTIGNEETVTWNASSVIEAVDVELSRDNGATWQMLSENVPNDGDFVWQAAGPETNTALVRLSEVSSVHKEILVLTDDHSTTFPGEGWDNAIDNDLDGADGMVTDMSNPPFAVFGFMDEKTKILSKIRLITDSGNAYTDRWVRQFTVQTSMTPDNFQTVLSATKTGGDWEEFTFDPVTAKYVKLIIDEPTGGWRQLTEFEVHGYSETPSQDVSNAVFSIGYNINLTVTSPNGGEDWWIGENTEITWSTQNGGDQAKIELSRDNGGTWTTLVESTENDGSWNYNVTGPDADQALVRITDLGTAVSDVSNAVYNIIEKPNITITRPNGGEALSIGEVEKINWTSLNTSGAVKIMLSKNNGESWGTVADSTADDGEWDWTVGGPGTSTALIRIVDYVNDAISDVSDAVFTIQVKPNVNVLAPNGGESFNVGAIMNITWLSANAGGQMKIELSRDAGQTWEVVVENTNDNGKYDWNVAGPASANCLIRVGAPSGDPIDVSDAVFSIFAQAEITIVEPNGGESFTIGNKFNILWNSVNVDGPVNIDLSRDSGQTWEALAEGVENNGNFLWTIEGPSSDNCLVRIADVSGTPVDMSDAVFSINDIPSLEVTSPNGGEKFYIGANQPILWNSSNTSGNVKIEISRDNSQTFDTLVETMPDTGKFNWLVAGTTSANCIVKVSDVDGDPMDTSDAVFSIVEEPAIVVTAPNGGEVWNIGTVQAISWGSVNTSGNVMIELSRNGGSSWDTLIESTPDTGSYNWSVVGESSDNCMIKVSDVAGDLSDSSDAVFSIQQQPVIAVTTPNGGEKWLIESEQVITWTATNTSGQVQIELSRDNKKSWEIIGAQAEDNGSYTWTVAGNASDSCSVRITDVDGSPVDESDAIFSIEEKPQINLTMPVGGEMWAVGTEQQIAWTSVNISSNILINLSRDNGSTWEELVNDAENTGSWTWMVEGEASDSCLFKISDESEAISDVSDSVFTIYIAPVLTLLTPNGGEIWEIGLESEISWEANYDDGTLDIWLKRDNDGEWIEILSDVDVSLGTINYLVSGELSDSCLIRITDSVKGLNDVSDDLFVIEYQTGIKRLGNATPNDFALNQNYPNPFNPETRISYQIPKQADVQISIFNMRGELVRVLVSESQAPGVYETTWDGRNAYGGLASSGIYFYKMQAGDFKEVKRLTFMK